MESQTRMTIPYLRAWRLFRLMTHNQLAEKADVGRETIFRLERGQRANELTIYKLAKALETTPEKLLNERPERAA